MSFYDDQMTHHAAALTYYSLMSLFPATLLGLSLLGLLGQYPSTYDAVINYLRDVVPHSALVPLDSSLRQALQHKGTAVTTFVISIALTLYGTTGVLEAARRALNVVFELDGGGRSFLRRKSTDIVFTFVLMGLVLASLIMVFVGGRFASDLFGFIGLGPTAASIWSVARWPGALAITMLIFALIYYQSSSAPMLLLSVAEIRSKSPGAQARRDVIRSGSKPVAKVLTPASSKTTRGCPMINNSLEHDGWFAARAARALGSSPRR